MRPKPLMPIFKTIFVVSSGVRYLKTTNDVVARLRLAARR